MRKPDLSIVEKGMKQMFKLLRSQIYNYNMYCIDIKPGNFIYNRKGNRLMVRMIDFGKDWCDQEIPEIYRKITKYPDKQKNLLFIVVMLQFFMIIYDSYFPYFTKKGQNDRLHAVFKPFFKNKAIEWAMNNQNTIVELLHLILSEDRKYTGHIFKYYVNKGKSNEKVVQKVINTLNGVYEFIIL